MSVDWAHTRLSELIEIKHGWAFKGSHIVEDLDEGPIVVAIGNFDYSGGFKFDSTKIKRYIGKYPKEYELNAGEILLAMTCQTAGGEILGIPGRIPSDGDLYLHNQRLGKVIVKNIDMVDDEFLYWLFLSKPFKHHLFTTATGTKILHTSPDKITSFEFNLPSIEEQRAIGQVFSSFSKLRDVNRRINQTLEEMAQAIFKSWFVNFEPVKAKIEAKANDQDQERAAMCAISGKTERELDRLSPDQLAQLQNTAALFPDELTDSELGLIPIGWKVKKIEEIIERFPVGKKYSKKTASEKGKTPVLDQGKSGIIGYHNEKPGVSASPDDPIIVFANHTCYMRLIMHNFSAIQNVLPYKGTGLDIYWVYVATYGKQKFLEYKGHWPDLVIKKIIVPSKDLDKKFGEHVDSFFKQIFHNDTQSTTLAEVRDTLLPKLLSGEIEVGLEA